MSAVKNKPLAQNPRCANAPSPNSRTTSRAPGACRSRLTSHEAAIPTSATRAHLADNPSALIRDKVPRVANIANPAAIHSGHAEPTATASAASTAPPTTTARGGARAWTGDHNNRSNATTDNDPATTPATDGPTPEPNTNSPTA